MSLPKHSQISEPYIVIVAAKSVLFVKLIKSIGSSEPTYVSRNDDWFKTLPNLILCDVSITSSLYALLGICHTWCIFSHPVIFWLSTRNWFYCPLICAQPWTSMDYQYHRIRLQLFSSESVLAGYSVVSWRGKKVVKGLEGGQKEWKTREKKKVSNFPRNENAYSREIEGGKNEWINWGRRKRWDFCWRWKQNKRGREKRWVLG